MKIQASLPVIKGMLNSSEPETAQHHEAMPAAINEFNLTKYFRVCASHGTNELELQKNGFYTFYDCKKTVKIVETINIDCGNPSISDINPSVFDYLPDIYCTDDADETAVRILTTVNNEEILLGHFLIEMKSIILTDLTHADREHGGDIAFNLIGSILDVLKEKEYIVPLEASNETKDELGFDFSGLTFGCDPEFEYVESGTVKSASVGLRNVSNINGGSDKIGLDGCGHPIELRPKAFNNVGNLINELKTLFSKINMHHFTTVGNTYAIGGHLHVGFGLSSSISPTNDLLKLLDYFIGIPSLSLSGSARGSYSQLASYRTKSYGFEYRTPSAANFTNPRIARITFTILKNIVTDYMKRKEFEIGHNLTAGELVKYVNLSEDDAGYYMNFFKVFKRAISISDNIVDFWVNDTSEIVDADELDLESADIEETPTFNIMFNDHWSPQSIDIFRSAIMELESDLVHPVSIQFFGWSESRGNVISGFELDGYEVLLAPSHPVDLIFGIPYTARADGTGIGDIVDSVLDVVKNYI